MSKRAIRALGYAAIAVAAVVILGDGFVQLERFENGTQGDTLSPLLWARQGAGIVLCILGLTGVISSTGPEDWQLID